tara:strand:+ start:377 stop:1048 length:672 start_codon:yes stop_codon:yes gene_type:complete
MDNIDIDISLIITNYNRAEFIDRAIRSCLHQLILRRNIEVIVVDDASDDGSLEVLQEFSKDVKIIVNDTNKGVAYCSNIGLLNARGKYWMRVDSDDFLNDYACAFMSAVLDENEEIHYVYCDHFRVDTRGVKISKIRRDTEKVLFEHGAGIMFRTGVLKEVEGYDESLRNCEDYDLLYRLKKRQFKGFYIPIPLYRYYIHGRNITLTPDREKFRKIVEAKHGI